MQDRNRCVDAFRNSLLGAPRQQEAGHSGGSEMTGSAQEARGGVGSALAMAMAVAVGCRTRLRTGFH
ncbi:hypothetical protein A7M48_22925 [Acinetobacter baumannii]|nr:hypothetical protein A7M48_22925 [Acinetobacter baumannii]